MQENVPAPLRPHSQKNFWESGRLVLQLFFNIAVGAMDYVGAGVGIPIFPFADVIPLCFSTLEGYTRQRCALIKRIIPNIRHAVWNCYVRQRRAVVERSSSNARNAVRNSYTH